MNQIQVIQPYRHAGTWVFDDARVGLVQEPFVEGIPTLIDRLVAEIAGAEAGFRLLFSPGPFPGAAVHLARVREEAGGWWYRAVEFENAEGWLCPALFHYFETAPHDLYVKAEALRNDA